MLALGQLALRPGAEARQHGGEPRRLRAVALQEIRQALVLGQHHVALLEQACISPPVLVSGISVRFSGRIRTSMLRNRASTPGSSGRAAGRRARDSRRSAGKAGGSVPPGEALGLGDQGVDLRIGEGRRLVVERRLGERAARQGDGGLGRVGIALGGGRRLDPGAAQGIEGRHRHVGRPQGQLGGDLHVGVERITSRSPARSLIGALKAVLVATIISSRTSRSPLRATSPEPPSPWGGRARSGGVATTPSAAARKSATPISRRR